MKKSSDEKSLLFLSDKVNCVIKYIFNYVKNINVLYKIDKITVK